MFDTPWLSAIIMTLGALVIGSGFFAYLRRPRKKSAIAPEPYFQNRHWLEHPPRHPSYCDSTAHLMAELADLAYFQFEDQFEDSHNSTNSSSNCRPTIHAENHSETNAAVLAGLIDPIGEHGTDGGTINQATLKKLLQQGDFELLETIHVKDTQGFACKYIGSQSSPYVVIAFRGTEGKISDWLTDAKAKPRAVNQGIVHSGFYSALCEKESSDSESALDIVERLMKSPHFFSSNNNPLPLYFTGHSLGGALAILATQLAAKDIHGACYTFGGPRVGNLPFFEGLKTPVYRVVNSSDIVPRVPPGAVMKVVLGSLQLSAWLTKPVRPLSRAFAQAESLLDKLNGFRHVGSLRHLTDISPKKIAKVDIRHRAPLVDRLLWFWQSLAANLLLPIRSHSMSLYRKKLLHLANKKMSSQHSNQLHTPSTQKIDDEPHKIAANKF